MVVVRGYGGDDLSGGGGGDVRCVCSENHPDRPHRACWKTTHSPKIESHTPSVDVDVAVAGEEERWRMKMWRRPSRVTAHHLTSLVRAVQLEADVADTHNTDHKGRMLLGGGLLAEHAYCLLGR